MVVLNEVDEIKMFWGVSLDGGKRYTQIVETSFHISMAALEPTTGDVPKDKRFVSLWIQHEKAELLLCTLENHKTMQQRLDLNFVQGEEITLFTTGGNGTIHLSGYLVDDPDIQNEMDNFSEEDVTSESEAEVPELLPLDDSLVKGKKRKMIEGNAKKKKQKVVLEEDFDSSDDEDDADYTLDDENMLSGDEDDDDDDDDDEDDDEDLDDDDEEEDDDDEEDEEEDDDVEEEISDMEKEISFKKKKTITNTTPSKPKETPKSKSNGTPAESQSRKKKKNKDKDTSINTSINEPQKEKKDTPHKVNTPSKRVLADGLVVEDIKIGNGPAAKSNKMVQMYYVGRLSNGKQFDSCSSGKPFKFRLGKKEVIKGWDIGVQGMKVGGKRRLIVPPKLGYGNHKQGPIPGNSTLIFDVELKSVS